MSEIEKQVKEMIAKAVKTDKADDALKFSQAALNAAHASQVLLASPFPKIGG